MNRRLIPLFLLLSTAALILFGCQGSKDTQEPAAPVETTSPGQEEAAPVQKEAEPVVSVQKPPGDFNLPAPESGLDSLTSYHQTFEMRFDGTLSGQPYSNSTKVDYSFIQDPYKELSLFETSDQDGQPLNVLSAVIGKSYFLRTGADGLCESIFDESLDENMKPVEPVRLLPLVYGAEEVGPENVNGIDAVHYKFDERSLRQYGQAKASGSVWVAAQGGWVVRYELTVDAPVDVLGVGMQGKQTWVYNVTDAGGLETIELPEGCQYVLVVINSTPGAQNVVRMPGYLSFTTQESREEILAFYQENLEGQGWEKLDVYEEGGEDEVLVYRYASETYLSTAAVTLSSAETGTEVTVHMVEGVPAPEPTAVP